jgi:cobalamin synthase
VVVVSLAVAAVAAAFARARLGGGLTGDGYGFAIVLAEVAGLSALAI